MCSIATVKKLSAQTNQIFREIQRGHDSIILAKKLLSRELLIPELANIVDEYVMHSPDFFLQEMKIVEPVLYAIADHLEKTSDKKRNSKSIKVKTNCKDRIDELEALHDTIVKSPKLKETRKFAIEYYKTVDPSHRKICPYYGDMRSVWESAWITESPFVPEQESDESEGYESEGYESDNQEE